MNKKEISNSSLNIAIAIKMIMILAALVLLTMMLSDKFNLTAEPHGSTMAQQEKDMYNARIRPYVGDGIRGSEVKSMIDNIISMNQENVGEQGKFIGITVGNITNYSTDDSLNNVASLCQKATVYPMPKEDGTEENPPQDSENNDERVKAATEAMTTLKMKIDSKKSYTVTAAQVGGMYTWINITEMEASTN